MSCVNKVDASHWRSTIVSNADRISDAIAKDAGAHVYHFGHYEPSAFKRLACRHATRADQLDELLRGERFVDLHTVVRQSMRAGVESYSIKQLEQFYGFTRAMPLRDASVHLHAVEVALEARVPTAVSNEARTAVAAYNQDDCRSTAKLRDWLERLRTDLMERGAPVPRPVAKDGEASEKVSQMERSRRRRGRGCSTAWPSRPASRGIPIIRDGGWRTSLTGIGGRRSRRGGSTTACATCRRTNCSTSPRRLPG